jgi:Ser/Thr protein kinase RdoA (MazF antagonist)
VELDRKARREKQSELVLSLYRERQEFPQAWEALMRPLSILRGVLFDAWFSANWAEPGFRQHYPDDDIAGEAYWLRSIEAMEGWLAG